MQQKYFQQYRQHKLTFATFSFIQIRFTDTQDEIKDVVHFKGCRHELLDVAVVEVAHADRHIFFVEKVNGVTTLAWVWRRWGGFISHEVLARHQTYQQGLALFGIRWIGCHWCTRLWWTEYRKAGRQRPQQSGDMPLRWLNTGGGGSRGLDPDGRRRLRHGGDNKGDGKKKSEEGLGLRHMDLCGFVVTGCEWLNELMVSF